MQLFTGLDSASLERLATGLRTRRFRRDEVLFHQGDPGDALFIVTSGAVKISLPSEEGDEAILATVRRATSSASWRCSTARPARPRRRRSSRPRRSSCRARFRELIASEPAIRDALLASLAGELRRLTNHVEELHFLDITGRLAARLARLATGQGSRPATAPSDSTPR